MNVQAVLGRAYAAANTPIQYGLGKGGFDPDLATPAPAGLCDCSGFVAWCLGFSRQVKDKFYLNFNNGWFETTAIWNDIGSSYGILHACKPIPGAVIVYPDSQGHQGHVGIIIDEKLVVHCSVGNDKKGNAIQFTAPDVFTKNPVTRIGWLVGLEP